MTNEGNNGFTNVNEDIANTLTQNYANANSTIQMTNEELIAQARELCEEEIGFYNRQLEIYPQGSAPYKHHLVLLNSWTTHLAEMDEHHVGTNEGENHCWKDLGEYPCDSLVTKAKRLLGVE